jgi:hypothetical protein
MEYLSVTQGSLASLQNTGAPCRADQGVLHFPGSPQPHSAVASNGSSELNRRVRTRMLGGVGGVRPRGRPLSRFE